MYKTTLIVYDLRTQNLNFVSPVPEQIGTTTMHFPEVSGVRLVTSRSQMVRVVHYIPVRHDMMRQTNDCSPVWVMQHKVKYFLYLQVDPALGPAANLGL